MKSHLGLGPWMSMGRVRSPVEMGILPVFTGEREVITIVKTWTFVLNERMMSVRINTLWPPCFADLVAFGTTPNERRML
jgi:hypothetical protein